MKKTTAKRLTKADLVRELRAAHKNARDWEAIARRNAEAGATARAEARAARDELTALRNRGHEPVLRHDALTAIGPGPRVTFTTGGATPPGSPVMFDAVFPGGGGDPIYCQSPEQAEQVAAALNAAEGARK